MGVFSPAWLVNAKLVDLNGDYSGFSYLSFWGVYSDSLTAVNANLVDSYYLHN